MILVGGENLIDFIQKNDGSGMPCYRAIPGGSPYNVAKALALQGVDTGYLTPISTDTLGDLLVESLPKSGLTLLSPRSDHPTSLAVVSVSNGQPAYQFYRENTAERDVSAASLQHAIPQNTKAFYIGSLAITNGPDADAWQKAWMSAHQRGVFTAIDPNIRPAFIPDRTAYLARLETMLKQADLIKLSDEDIAWIAPDLPILDAAQAMFERSTTAMLVLTLGSKGAVGFTKAGRIIVAPAPVVDLKDTVGAGDTFMATLIAKTADHNLLGKASLANADRDIHCVILETASKAAAINCGRVGCQPPVLSEL